jgi:type IV pilus assembly protein PilV
MKFHPATRRHSKYQQGMTLIEVVVAIVILAVGALGVAGLQARALKGNESSLQRTQAVIAANSLIDALHANVLPRNNVAMTCNGGAGYFAIWLGDLQANLGAGSCGQITCAANANPAGTTRCIVTVQWNDQLAGGGANQQLQLTALF